MRAENEFTPKVKKRTPLQLNRLSLSIKEK